MLTEQIRNTIKQYAMLGPGQKAVCGVSGGPDSMTLLSILHRLSEEEGFTLHAAYLDHGLRPSAAAEGDLAADYCLKLGVPFSRGYADIARLSQQQRTGIEEAGRQARYAFLRSEMVRVGASKIAVGHQLEDNAETVLMNLMRGSGTAGLCGIQPLQGDIIRPLLFTSRKEILDYAEHNHVPFITDESNLNDEFTRNRVRHTLIPAMKTFNPEVTAAIARCARTVSDDEDLLRRLTESFFDACVKVTQNGLSIDAKRLGEAHPALARRTVREAAARLTGPGDFQSVNVDHILHLGGLKPGSSADLPGGLRARRGFASIDLQRAEGPAAGIPETPLQIPGTTHVDGWGHFQADIIHERPGELDGRLRGEAYFDHDDFPQNVVIRSRRDGDIIRPLGGGSMKLKKYLSQRKIEPWERNTLAMLACGAQILWVPGMDLSDNVKIKETTRNFLRVTYHKEENERRQTT
jgi:tRNA(Ile)-lysidine synthase